MPPSLGCVSHLAYLIESLQEYLVGRDYESHFTDKKTEIKMLGQGPASE